MAAVGLNAAKTISNQFDDVVDKAINFGIEVLRYAKSVTFGKNEKISFKIGIHYGKVIAGVIGHHKP
jgi:class 3 adenylate cyclase